jgi:hypothetical protein
VPHRADRRLDVAAEHVRRRGHPQHDDADEEAGRPLRPHGQVQLLVGHVRREDRQLDADLRRAPS